MDLKDFTITVTVDERYIQQLIKHYPLWVQHKPEIKAIKKLLFLDKTQIKKDDPRLKMFDNTNTEMLYWDPEIEYENQREKMLTCHTISALYVDTPYFIKIDCDAFAVDGTDWLEEPKDLAFIASPWGYTKPANRIEILDDWGDIMPQFAGTQRLNLPYSRGSDLIKHSRICSWLYIGNTAWTRHQINNFKLNNGFKLPVPSQDTVLWYCAARTNHPYKVKNFKKYGWNHQ